MFIWLMAAGTKPFLNCVVLHFNTPPLKKNAVQKEESEAPYASSNKTESVAQGS